ncbi:NAD(P)H-quinone oxidoreductase [Beijerinckia indica]|uniref:NAD(P)H quinone oxidoreductase, PIG3 family n=1 Tax=Beijerinckia indica subsp. indica (strain ATCC 9039 / DSM 1715 / NCIMB 8712) TaxID=395963 RepID=B2IJL5_BEII9|nr:NAD(P)H-quinone oxidoreductase [Beijerinckia indica]ACB94887.1 NAD(P)H quinone oxidoreductase, PIG3 family [Beijerinckia indica subsp. indica ATCC 9039]
MAAIIPDRMRQIYFDGKGGPEVIRVGEAEVPTPGRGKVLIEVAAAGINRPDCVQRAGFYPPPPGESEIPGLEVAGKIVKLGEGVSQWQIGDEVCALLGSGGYAEYALADAALCLPVPKGLSLIEAAALPETYFTVYDNVFTRGRLQPGENFLIHGGSSGIGSTAIQLAKQFGAKVFTTAGSAEKCAFCRTLGADHAIDYKTSDFVEEIRKITDNKYPIDVILDMVGGSYIAKNLSLLNFDGRMVQIAFLQSPKVASFDFLPLMLRRLTMTGSTLRARALGQKIEIAEALRELVWPLLDQGLVKPMVHATFPLEEARQSHELMESSAHLGKILLVTGLA